MELTAELPEDRRARVDTRLHTNLMAWLTTVSPVGLPDTVPVWFLLRDDDSVLVYSQPGAMPPAALEDLINQVKSLDMQQVRAKIAARKAAAAS